MNLTLLLMATGGGFCGVTIALLIGFVSMRAWIRHRVLAWMGAAHRASECPICKSPMRHDDVPGPDEEHS